MDEGLGMREEGGREGVSHQTARAARHRQSCSSLGFKGVLLLSASLDLYQASAALRAHYDARLIHVNIRVALPTRALCPEKSIPPPRCSCPHNILQKRSIFRQKSDPFLRPDSGHSFFDH